MEINKIELVAVYLTGPGLQAEFRLEDIGTITYTFPYSFYPREDKHKRPDLFINAIKEIAKEWKEEKRVVEYRKVRNCIKSDDLGCLVTRRNHDDSFHEASICQNRILKEDIQNGYCEFYSSGSGRCSY